MLPLSSRLLCLASVVALCGISPAVDLPPGSLDPAFPAGGSLVTVPGNPWLAPKDMEFGPDGSIYLLSSAGQSANAGPYSAAITKFTSNGTPDATFGTGGTVIVSEVRSAVQQSLLVRDLAVLPDGKVLLAVSH